MYVDPWPPVPHLEPILRSNARAVKIYNATGSLARFENRNIFFSSSKNVLAYYIAGVVNSKVVGLATGKQKDLEEILDVL
jgi:hypothetical protein